MSTQALPGSGGEHFLQERQGSEARAAVFYQRQILHHLNPFMQRFIAEQEMVFIGTADARGQCDSSFRAGPRGFVRVLNEKMLLFPDYRGNGVFASMGNILENPHIGLLFIDFFHAAIGLHVNGKARLVGHAELPLFSSLAPDFAKTVELSHGRPVELWVGVTVEEAYVHCSKHIPRLVKGHKEIDWGTDDLAKKKGDYFHPANAVAIVPEVNGYGRCEASPCPRPQ
jgi:predicted pyridoxine 5'-phosphate oxidase superfamily flavin-nucleotide-binding protein